MIHKVKKLDKRYNGGDRLRYMVDVNYSKPSDGNYANRMDKIKE